MKSVFKILFVLICLLGAFATAQEIQLPGDLPENYIFTQSIEGYPKIIVKKGYYKYKTNWVYSDFDSEKINNISVTLESIKDFNNLNFEVLKTSKETLLVLSGGGYVFSQTNEGISRVDSSVQQKNQFNASVFFNNNQIFMYGGYGFWTFKDYITYFDKATGQWEILNIKSEYIPAERWKAVFQVIDQKLYVFGGRNNPKGSVNKDIALDDFFYLDLTQNKFVDLGKINPKTPIKYSLASNVIIDNKKAYLEKDRIVFFDFKKDSIKSYYKKNLFEGIDTQKPVLEHQNALYYIAKKNETSFLIKFPISNLKDLKSVSLPLSSNKTIPFQTPLAVFLAILICWVSYKLFTYKDLLKGLVLFDEKRIYYGQESSFLSEQQLKLIRHLEKNNQITAIELNEIISSKKYVKSHFTLLRTAFVTEINSIYKSVTNNELVLIEEIKDPVDNRYKIYRITKQLSQKESFFTFLFKL